MVAKLIIISGDTDTTEVTLSPPAVIGRSRKADITIGHPLVSRRHCEIVAGEDNKYVVRDLGSLNGTFIGKEKIDGEAILEEGDLLTVGTVTFRADFGEAGKPAADPAESAPATGGDEEVDFMVDDATTLDAPTSPEAPAAQTVEETLEVDLGEDLEVDDGTDVTEKDVDKKGSSKMKVEAKPTDSDKADDDGFDLAWLEDGDD